MREKFTHCTKNSRTLNLQLFSNRVGRLILVK